LRHTLRRLTQGRLPPGKSGAFDHGDVDPNTGRIFVAHTEFGTLDVIDPSSLVATAAIPGCPDGSGVVCAGDQRLVFAASRGSAKVLMIDADRLQVVGELKVGPKPNGLAWDDDRGQLLVADVDPSDQAARLIRVGSKEMVAVKRLPGRPRWCVFDAGGDRFLVNIREPASVVTIAAASGEITDSWSISSAGPHGLDIDRHRRRAFVACDDGQLLVVDLASGQILDSIAISGEPDAIWFNERRQRLYVGIGRPGLLDVVDTERAVLIDSIPTELGAKTSAFDVARRRLYVFLPESSAAAVLEEI
jgi:DNA-binding beta-propeller fold protein YncE